MKYVLFVCNHNARQIWPSVVEVMAEVGIDLAGRKPRKLLREMQLHADWAVTMGCGDACPYVPTTVEAWDVPDPSTLELDEVRKIRDLIEVHVRELIDTKLEAIRTDRTAHQRRLAKMIPELAREFEAVRAPEEIRACADAVLTQYDDARVRSHIETLALRQTRECLRRDVCDLVPA